MTVAEQIIRAKNDYDLVYNSGYEKGKQEEYDRFWDAYQSNGNRIVYVSAFEGEWWNNQNFKPKYNIVPINCYRMFAESGISGDLVKILEDLGVVIDTSSAVEVAFCFAYTKLTHIGEVSFERISSLSNCFRTSKNLETIDLIKLKSDGTNSYSNSFYECYALKNIRFSGVIGNNISFLHSTLLSAESIRNIVEHLSDTTTVKAVTFSSTAINNAFSSDEWQALKETKPNWEFIVG